MVSASEPVIVRLVSNGGAVYATSLRVNDASELRVWVTLADGTASLLTSGYYAVSLSSEKIATLTFNYPPVLGSKITVIRTTSGDQNLDLISNSRLPAEDFEAEFDKLTRLIREQSTRQVLSFHDAEPAGSPSTLPLPPFRADRVLYFNNYGSMEMISMAALSAKISTRLSLGTIATGAAGTNASATIEGVAPDQVLSLVIPKGDTGAAGGMPEISVEATTLPAGSTATATITGNNTNPILNLGLPTGPAGPTGLTGGTGSAGPSNSLSIASVSTGAAGSAATVSVGGTSPNQTLTFSIPRGDTGATGSAGAVGAAATISVGTVSTVAFGSGATITNSGNSSAAVLNFAIQRGATGGPGSAATITLGTVTTGSAGSSASVSNSGNSSAATLNFAIPRGDTGATGLTGPQPSLTVVDNAGTSITLADGDNNAIIRCTSASAVAITVPSTLAAGFSCMVIQSGAGQVTISAGAGATLNSFGNLLKTAGQHAPASIIRVEAGIYNLSGNLI